jgi:hypothetical protein
MYEIQIPDWTDIKGPWREVEQFDTQAEMLEFAQENFGADEEGRINICHAPTIDDPDTDTE